MQVITKQDIENLATKEDLLVMKSELKSELREEFGEKLEENSVSIKSELRREMALLKTELRGEIKELRTELKQDISDVRVELINSIDTGFSDVISKLQFLVEQAGGDRVDALEADVELLKRDVKQLKEAA